jgi:O-antigen/teichoic acid export membrane protein
MLAQQIVSGLKWSALGRFVPQLISWAATIVIIRLLSPDDYGLLAMAQSFLVFVAFINELGMGWSVVRSERVDMEHEVPSLQSAVIGLNLLLFGICWLAAPGFAHLMGEPRLSDVLRVLALRLIVSAFAVMPRSLLVREMRFKETTIVVVASTLATSFATLLLAVLDFRVWALVYGSLVGAAVEALGYCILARLVPRLAWRWRLIVPHISFGLVILLQRVVWLAYSRADILILGTVFGTRLVGIYAIGQELASLPLDRMGQIVNQVVFAGFSRIRNDPERRRDYLMRGIRLAGVAAFPVFLGMAAVADPLIIALVGEQWREAIVVLQLTALVLPFQLFFTMIVEVLNASGLERAALQDTAIVGVAVVAGILAGVGGGLAGVRIGWGAGFLVAFAIVLLGAERRLGISLRRLAGDLWGVVTAAALMFAGVSGLVASGLIRPKLLELVVAVPAGIAIYGLGVLLLARPALRELDQVRRLALKPEAGSADIRQ